jgi:hypothetical protein
MAMTGPDFKAGFIDSAPSSNADVGQTIASLMALKPANKGKLLGRVLTEALPNGATPAVESSIIVSDPAANGLQTVINLQKVGDTRYFDAAGFPGRTLGLSAVVPASPAQ